MKKEILFALAMSVTLGVSIGELVDAQNAFVEDFKKQEAKS